MSVLLLRHVHAGDRASWAGDDRRRPASDLGRAQAEALVAHLATVRHGRALVAVWSSPYQRCLDSVAALAADAEVHVEEVGDLAEGAPPDVVDRLLRTAARTATDADGVVVLCSHGDVIGDAVQGWISRGWLEVADARWPKASTWVVDGPLDAPELRFLAAPTTG